MFGLSLFKLMFKSSFEGEMNIDRSKQRRSTGLGWNASPKRHSHLLSMDIKDLVGFGGRVVVPCNDCGLVEQIC